MYVRIIVSSPDPTILGKTSYSLIRLMKQAYAILYTILRKSGYTFSFVASVADPGFVKGGVAGARSSPENCIIHQVFRKHCF